MLDFVNDIETEKVLNNAAITRGSSVQVGWPYLKVHLLRESIEMAEVRIFV
jgi:hypothetical protein